MTVSSDGSRGRPLDAVLAERQPREPYGHSTDVLQMESDGLGPAAHDCRAPVAEAAVATTVDGDAPLHQARIASATGLSRPSTSPLAGELLGNRVWRPRRHRRWGPPSAFKAEGRATFGATCSNGRGTQDVSVPRGCLSARRVDLLDGLGATASGRAPLRELQFTQST